MNEASLISLLSGLIASLPAILVCVMQNNSSKKIMEYRIKEITDLVNKIPVNSDRLLTIENELKDMERRLDKLEAR